jgi:hypothetical protein
VQVIKVLQCDAVAVDDDDDHEDGGEDDGGRASNKNTIFYTILFKRVRKQSTRCPVTF